MSYLFNEPGSRLHIDDRTGRREMTLHISLKPIPELRRLERTGPPRQYMKQARTARDRHRVAEIVCFVRFEHEWELPAPSKQYDNVEWVFNVKLKPNQKPVRVENSTARQQRLAREVSAEKQPDDVEGKRRATQDTALQKATSAETSSSRPLRVQPRRAQSLQVELPRLPRPSSAPVPDEKGHTRSASRLSASAGDAPAEKPPTTAPEGPHDLASAQLREMVLNQATESPIFVPSVEEQMLAQSMRSSSISGSAYDQSSLGQPSPFVPSDLSSVPPPPLPLPPPGQPFYGPDGMTYVVDHVTGQPQVFNAPPPWLQHYPYPDQGFMDYGPPPPLYMASGPNTPSFFTPPKSSKLEIKAPPGKRRALHASSMSASSSVTGASERTNEPTFTVPNHHYGYRPPYNPYDYGYGPPPFDQNEYHPPGVPRGYPSMMGHSMPPPGMPSHPLHHQHINPQMTEEYPHHQSSTP